MDFKELEKLIKICRKNDIQECKFGEISIVFRENAAKLPSKRLGSREKAMVSEIRKEALMEEMRIMDPAAYEEQIALHGEQ